MGPRAGLDDMERRKMLPLLGSLGCQARRQSLYRSALSRLVIYMYILYTYLI
jgi:hypothetical protein